MEWLAPVDCFASTLLHPAERQAAALSRSHSDPLLHRLGGANDCGAND